ncbi:syntaxin of plants SYP7 [Strigomonas culicis]|uniref:Syntaxin of plants SYP7 n=1 Tax=Strigomonas culicis TaxID=28005 RepID=S9UJF1_9TRYP|nr:syntaxin of plants SYP7 [Strigomonas culicis]|eukprot:EPY29038.1 syntaxin of plants SYP7 [Strigomonas culicis]
MEKRIDKLSPYQKVEIRTLLEIAKMRKTLKQIELLNRQGASASGDGAAVSDQMKYHLESQRVREVTQLRQFCRRQYRVLQDLQREAEQCFYAELRKAPSATAGDADGDDRDAEMDFPTLNTHLENAIQYYRHVFDIAVVTSTGGSVRAPMPTLTREERRQYWDPQQGGEETEALLGVRQAGGQQQQDFINAREDQEFEHFFVLTEQKDRLIDEALDRIHVSVLRLKDNAQFISHELDTQAHVLDETEVHIEQTEAHVRQLNKRLDVAIKEIHTSSVCSYVLCLLFLLFVLCLLLRVAT